MVWPTVPYSVSSTMNITMPPEPEIPPLYPPIMFFNDTKVEGAALETSKSILLNSIGNGGPMPYQEAQGIEKYIPLIIIGLVLYFIFK